ncbi:MAG: hypothetical protein A3E01_08225 [Gammaproteobacteria bacterium RIFCSPHIGHO2_12_FULL_63_22]|nr:MAG: hypothetical protein A3E01_08225 [Gammaproteobacteria bacterium RIFCSPHIGHO2_12_FULL_63_22]
MPAPDYSAMTLVQLDDEFRRLADEFVRVMDERRQVHTPIQSRKAQVSARERVRAMPEAEKEALRAVLLDDQSRTKR